MPRRRFLKISLQRPPLPTLSPASLCFCPPQVPAGPSSLSATFGLQRKTSSFKTSPPLATTRSEVRLPKPERRNPNALAPPRDARTPSPTRLLRVWSPEASAKWGQRAGLPQEGRGGGLRNEPGAGLGQSLLQAPPPKAASWSQNILNLYTSTRNMAGYPFICTTRR